MKRVAIHQAYNGAYQCVKENPTEENKKAFTKICLEVLEELMIANQEVLKRLKTM